MNSPTVPDPVKIAALYRFRRLVRPEALRAPLAAFCARHGIRGTLIVAPEGINGTVAGPDAGVDALLAYLERDAGLGDLEVKFSRAGKMPFLRMKVRLKREIVTMGVEAVDPVEEAGTYVEPAEWNRLIDDPDTVVIDTRNDYEVSLGTFANALDPATRRFRDFPAWAEAHRDAFRGRKVAIFCTGGIRCEKATAYMKSIGIEEVFHLKGGILKYLEEIPAEASRWRGECFVFDERVSVGHGLAQGEASLCRACRHPLSGQDRGSPGFVEGVSCPHCADKRSAADRARYAERQRQVELADSRGFGPHLGQRENGNA
ncbi:rhodanese-related sulfurtransferase [Nitratireductor alexandrii]|uniref:oxygen-dependent tRNA uridine(34) hydroxylase TrhO n=1 Tax=Nitratireductor alexandrii TaxID=2448161 RepID=UPI000FDB985E|nr:rhodanese-related sulfurtransferase [Nitratireductor alexandrii]